MLRLVLGLILVASASWLQAGSIDMKIDDESQFLIFTIRQDDTVVRVAPAAGGNLFSLQVDGIEFFRQPQALTQLPGVGYGNPVLYPTPNRVKDAQFTFRDKRFVFTPNARGNFIHGLVNNVAWEVVDKGVDRQSASLTMALDFAEGTERYRRFPLAHQLRLTITVTDRRVRWTYTVDNEEGTEAVPFGFALHPYFVYQGDRAKTYLTIPATHWMESEQQLPSGRLVPGDQLDYPLGSPMSLEGTRFDDVFYGVNPDKPAIIDFRDVDRRVEITASDAFTHLVVWTPDRPYFGIESQTCATDAHNLADAGFTKAAHLQVAEAGEVKTGWVEYRIELP